MALRRAGVKTIAIGIGGRVDVDEIQTIGGSAENTIVAESFDDIFNQLDALRLEICKGTGSRQFAA